MGNKLANRSANPRVPTQFPVTILTARRQSHGQVITMSDTSMKIILKRDLALNKGDDIALSFSGGKLQGFMHRNEFYGQIIRRDERELQVYFGQNDDMTRRYLAALKAYKIKAATVMQRPKNIVSGNAQGFVGNEIDKLITKLTSVEYRHETEIKPYIPSQITLS
ncbi:MAG: PilZ domain-containing protein [Lentilitoribacter sp.]